MAPVHRSVHSQTVVSENTLERERYLRAVLYNFRLSSFGREKNEIPQTFPDERSR